MTRIVVEIAWTEVSGRLRRRGFHLVLLAVIGLVTLSVARGTDDLNARRAEYARQLQLIVQGQVTARLPLMGWSTEPVLRLPRPPELGSLIARGDDARTPPFFDFGPSGVSWGRSLFADTALPQTGMFLDVEAIIRVVGGLLAVLLGMDAVGRSRFSGQLQAWEVLGLSPVVGAMGKILGGTVVLVFSSIVVLTVAAVSAVLRLPDPPGAIAQVFLKSFVPMPLYLLGLAALGGALSVWCRTSAAAAIAGVAAWLVATVIGPQVMASAGQLTVHAPTRAEFEAIRDTNFAADIRSAEVALGNAVREWVGPAVGPIVDDAARAHGAELEAIWFGETRAARQSADTDEEAWFQLRQRQRLIDVRLQTLVPGTCVARAVSALAGTGDTLAQTWFATAEGYQDHLNAALFDNRPQANVRLPDGQLTRFRRHAPPQWSDMPMAVSPEADPVWGEASAPLAALLGFAVIATLGIVVGVRRLQA